MSIQLGSLVSHILYDHFGEIVQKVGSDLCRFGGKPIPLIIKTTSLPRTQIVQALRSLIKYGLVAFDPSKNETIADYRLIKENVLCLLRYPKYLFLIKNKFGFESELIVEEILQQGSITVSQLIINIVLKTKDDKITIPKYLFLIKYKFGFESELMVEEILQQGSITVSQFIINIVLKTKDDKERNVTPVSLRDSLVSLVTAGYIHQGLSPTEESLEADVPIFKPTEANNQALPEVDIRAIMLFINGDEKSEIKDAMHWRCNLDRFHQDFRDELMVTAMTRCIDECGGELMRQLLQQMYLRTDPWAVTSNPIPFVELKEYCKRSSADNPLLLQYLEQYLKVMEESTSGMISCTGSAGGGQYTLNAARAVELMLWDMICSTVQERLGTKAARVFRLIKSKKYIEEEDIQRNAMLPAKEAKQLTYKLLEEHFIEVQVMRKNASGSAGPSKAFYLYHIDLNHVANMALELTYKALYNAVTRREHERFTHKRMIEKQQRVDTIVHGMRMRGEPDENITDIEETVTPPEKVVLERIKQMIKKLSSAEIQLDETMFLLQTYFTYGNKK